MSQMSQDKYSTVSLHNVATLESPSWTNDGDQLFRVPKHVRAEVNSDAAERLRHPTGCEIRFVPDSATEQIEVTLSAGAQTRVHIFWGPFQPWEPIELNKKPKTLSLKIPERLSRLTTSRESNRFAPQVCRIRLERIPAVALHSVTGNCRPPMEDECPDLCCLSYGTSITEGAASSAPHLNYVSHLSRLTRCDVLNLGCSGSAYCEPDLGEYIASRDDWDVATLALSVNMANGGFSPDEFHERASKFVETVAAAKPRRPVVCVTLFPYFADVTSDGDAALASDYRSTLTSIVADASYPNLSVVSGPDLLDVSGLTADILHPGDTGMAMIGTELAQVVNDII